MSEPLTPASAEGLVSTIILLKNDLGRHGGLTRRMKENDF